MNQSKISKPRYKENNKKNIRWMAPTKDIKRITQKYKLEGTNKRYKENNKKI